MDFLKNILPDTPAKLEELVSIRKGQIVSMALSKVDNAQIALFAMSATELVSEETYWGDTVYYVLSGELVIGKDGLNHRLHDGEIMAVPAHSGHSLLAESDTKFMQITLNTNGEPK